MKLTVTIELDVPSPVGSRHPLALLLDANKAFDGWPTHDDDVGRFACHTTAVAVAIEGQEVAAMPHGSIDAVRAMLEAESQNGPGSRSGSLRPRLRRDPQSVECPECGVAKGVPCVSIKTGGRRPTSHLDRVRAVR